MTKKIVFVDDEETIRKLVKIALDAEGYDCQIAANGEEGLTKIKQIKPDLAILDIMMAKMNGLELAENIKKDKNLENTKIIVLSAKDKDFCSVEDNDKLSQIDAYLNKPFDLNKLIKMITKYIGSK